MRIVVSDSSCLIDLRKAALLESFLKLPYEVLIPNTLFEDELLKFTEAQKQALLAGGLKVVDIPGQTVLRARELLRGSLGLSVNDGLTFALAESRRGSLLLTGDGRLRSVAVRHGIEVHGVLWIVDEHRGVRHTGRRLARVGKGRCRATAAARSCGSDSAIRPQ